MIFLFKYTAGYAFPALTLLVLLVEGHNSDTWSGNSPLNSWPVIPIFYLVYLAVALLIVGVARRRPQKYAFLAGLIGGAPLFIFARQTASLFPGWGAIATTIFCAAACVVAAMWLGAERSARVGIGEPNA